MKGECLVLGSGGNLFLDNCPGVPFASGGNSGKERCVCVRVYMMCGSGEAVFDVEVVVPVRVRSLPTLKFDLIFTSPPPPLPGITFNLGSCLLIPFQLPHSLNLLSNYTSSASATRAKHCHSWP
jgi:hypothetical protein